VEEYTTARQARDDNKTDQSLFTLDNSGCRHTHTHTQRICNTYSFSTATSFTVNAPELYVYTCNACLDRSMINIANIWCWIFRSQDTFSLNLFAFLSQDLAQAEQAFVILYDGRIKV